MRLRILGLVALVLVVAVVAGRLSGRAAPADAVAEAERRLGIDLDADRIATHGIELFVVQAGPPDGPPVVLLHGFPEFWFGWYRQIGPLAKAGFRVIVPDQRGYDASDKPPAVDAYRIESLARDVAGLIQTLGHESAFVAGHDWGGAVAWAVAIHHPERVRKLAVVNTPHPLVYVGHAGRDDEETVSWYRTFFQLPVIPELVAPFGNWWLLTRSLRDSGRPGVFPDEEMPYYRYAWHRDGAMRTMIHWYRASFRQLPQLPEDATVRMPTRILLALHDAFIPTRDSRLSAAHCTDAAIVEFPEATHWVLHEEPERTSEVLIEFFRE